MRNTPLGTGSPGDRLSEKAQVDCLIILIARDGTHEARFGPGIPKLRALPAAAFLRASSASRLQLCYGEEEGGRGGLLIEFASPQCRLSKSGEWGSLCPDRHLERKSNIPAEGVR